MSQAGDLLFYVPDGHHPADAVIAKLTGGPYCHVAVAVGDGSVVAAIGRGVSHYPEGRPSLRLATGSRCANLMPSLEWLLSQVGRPYSYADVVDAAVALAWGQLEPSVSWGPFSVRVPMPQIAQLIQADAFDCSSLAARFLISAHLAGLPAGIAANPDISSPNSLARALSSIV